MVRSFRGPSSGKTPRRTCATSFRRGSSPQGERPAGTKTEAPAGLLVFFYCFGVGIGSGRDRILKAREDGKLKLFNLLRAFKERFTFIVEDAGEDRLDRKVTFL